MNITLNLNEAVVYLPSGKVMNLKDKLKWGSLEMTPEQLQEALKPVESEQFKMNLSFETLENDLAGDFMREQSHQRTELYKGLATQKFDNLPYLIKAEENLTAQVLDLFAILGESIMKDSRVSEKLQKLDRLKLINS
jgi:Txe/YoeB family toxin of Txe-Axe toxin-antitoxin module